MKRTDRVAKETRETAARLLKVMRWALAPVLPDKDEWLDRPWMYPQRLKKFEDASWTKERFDHMVRGTCLGVSAELGALKVLYEAQGKFHDPPRPGHRKL